MDEVLWKYLEELPEQETAWYELKRHLSDWRGFNNYLKVKENHAKFLACTTP